MATVGREVGIKRLSRFLGYEYEPSDFPAFPSHVNDMLSLVLIEIEVQQLGDSKPCAQQDLEDRHVAKRHLVASSAKVNKLFGRRP
jgi:hypothetical protein